MEGCPHKAYRVRKTRFALLWMHLTSEPFIALFTLLGFILRKDLGASMLQLSILAAIRPVISFFSFYWSSSLTRNTHKLLPNLIGAWILGRVPFLFFPFFNNAWYLIFACAIYQLFYRAGTPALIEILNQNIERKSREHIFSVAYLLSFAESILLGLFVGKVLDSNPIAWKLLLVATAVLSMSSAIFQKQIPIAKQLPDRKTPPTQGSRLIQPWKDCLYLMHTYPAFARFQWGFMIGGFGLMLMTPALTLYYAETLCLSHENLTVARYIWMGCGVLLSTSLWRHALAKYSVRTLTLCILCGFGLFPALLLLAQIFPVFLYFAFLFYGIAQAGSHLLWHLSGTLFASEGESSSKYTGTNVLMVGIRGLIGPALGGILTTFIGISPTLMIGAVICLLGALYMRQKRLELSPYL